MQATALDIQTLAKSSLSKASGKFDTCGELLLQQTTM